jgi:dihydrofolate reductase
MTKVVVDMSMSLDGFVTGPNAGLVDEIHIHLIPVLVGDGVRLFDHLRTGQVDLDRTRTIETPGATHLRFTVVK